MTLSQLLGRPGGIKTVGRDDPPKIKQDSNVFNKVLIANRGAIAVRIINTLKKINCTSVVIYSEADRESRHVSLADEAYSLGSGTANDTYLNQEKIFAIAKQANAEAIHPGYGFLSENSNFANECEKCGIVFLGPSSEHINMFGLKHRAREIANNNAIPLLPGTELLNSLDEAVDAAQKIGYPVMLKSTAGGGGIGMSRCNSEAELIESYESVKRLSENNFSNSSVFIEKFIACARHIEVQIFGDGLGNAISLGERDCSAQRRNQKVIEETPAPNLPRNIRNKLSECAKRLASSVKYRSAGTVEFIYDSLTSQFYFLEVNTRLQVEHGVTEQIYGIDLVQWMLELGANELSPLTDIEASLTPEGHSIQVRVYAENPEKNFQPSSGLLTQVILPELNTKQADQHTDLRIDHWISEGIEVSPFFDPMLAKIITTGRNREEALEKLKKALDQTHIYGVETNVQYVKKVLNEACFLEGNIQTHYLNSFDYNTSSIEVISPGTQTTIQDYPARTGYWHIGVPPSGPFDNLSFRLGNQLIGNTENAAGLEITLQGPKLKFNQDTQIVLAGAITNATLNKQPIPFWTVVDIHRGDTLDLGKAQDHGSRTYLLIAGGIDCPEYLGSKSTFTLGKFGGHTGRALQTGDVLHFNPASPRALNHLPESHQPEISHHWQLHVTYGPHGAPDFFTDEDIQKFFEHQWEVHYNSSRTGVRLIGPKPDWARSDGGEAGMHPSNIHDNAYAIGTVDFTGDMPVILGPDGPSLGGFVCPATVITADLWKLGQLKAGDKITFIPVSVDTAVALEKAQIEYVRKNNLSEADAIAIKQDAPRAQPKSCIVKTIPKKAAYPQVVYRPQGDHYLLIEYGELTLDIDLRFRVHALMLWLEKNTLPGMQELTPGIRSLQIHYDSQQLSLTALLEHLEQAENALEKLDNPEVEARIVHLPLSWDDEACRIAIEKYMQSVRQDAPWCPSNIEFIRRINGLESIEDVKRIVFDANYLVLGLGDVYLGAPVATPMDPRHRLVTTKYNPARTWTAENSVGIGGSYMCIYGMEGPGGYQFVGRTLQMWNRYKKTAEFEQPWLLRFFDQIKFYEISPEELQQIRQDFPNGQYPIKIEKTRFNLKEYHQFIKQHEASITTFTQRRDQAFDEELQRWIDSGQINFQSVIPEEQDKQDLELPENGSIIESHVAGNVWQILVKPEEEVKEGQTLCIIESMKMEIEITAPYAGKVHSIQCKEGMQVQASQPLVITVQ